MMKSEKDLMQGIDDKFQQLMSQFEQNMNILEKSKLSSPEISKENIAIETPKIRDESKSKESPTIKDKGKSNKPGSARIKSEQSGQASKEGKKTRDDGVYKDGTMGNILRYVSDCADLQNKKLKKKKTISFSQGQRESVDYVDNRSDDNRSTSVATGSKRSGRRKGKRHADTSSNTSSKKKTSRSGELIKKTSKTVTNTSKKVKRRQLKSQNPSKDWIAFNRTNAGKMVKSAPKNKTQSSTTEKDQKKRPFSDRVVNKSVKKEKVDEHKEPSYESIENKLISDFMQNEEKIKNKGRLSSALNRNNDRNKVIRNTTPIRNVKVDDKENQKKDKLKLLHTRSLTSAIRDKNEIKYSNEYVDREESKEYIARSGKERNKYYEVEKARSEMKMTSNYVNEFDQNIEVDEFFREIPFVAGRSISRTFNLGLSFQHAMSMLKRIHSKKEVKEVLNIGCNDNPVDNFHCLGSGTCEAMFHGSHWTKEDEEAWEENPWDPDLNRRRPKCTCLPNNSTTLKHVLKQLSTRNPNFNTRSSTALPYPQTAQRLESEIDMLKRPKLKKALSQTRTELLRNIRTIQIQLTPINEMLK